MTSGRRKLFYWSAAAFLGTPLVGGYAATYYLFPELRGNQSELLFAFRRMSRVGFAGLRMAYIYKFVK
jgi:hypothetical protein